MPELMCLRRYSRKQSCRAAALQNFPLDLLEPQPEVERSLFAPAERRPVRRGTDSGSLRRVPLETEFQVRQLVSAVAMTQRREAIPKCFERLELLTDLALVKSPARQPARQLALALGGHEPTCRLSPERPRARLLLPAIAAHQLLPQLAQGAWVELLSAAEHLSSKGYRSDRIARVGAQFSQAIRGSFP